MVNIDTFYPLFVVFVRCWLFTFLGMYFVTNWDQFPAKFLRGEKEILWK